MRIDRQEKAKERAVRGRTAFGLTYFLQAAHKPGSGNALRPRVFVHQTIAREYKAITRLSTASGQRLDKSEGSLPQPYVKDLYISCYADPTFDLISLVFCANLNAMAAPDDTRRFAYVDGSSSVNTQGLSLKDCTQANSASSNDCDWLHEVMSSHAISAGRINPQYLVRVFYKEMEAAPTTTIQDFGTGSFALLALKECLVSKYIRAVILCHRDSSQVDPRILDLLWTELNLEVSFMRHHFDYKEFRNEPGCPEVIRSHLKKERDQVEEYWTFGGRWNPIRLPSETRASIIRLSVGSECLSVCCRGGIGESGFF